MDCLFDVLFSHTDTMNKEQTLMIYTGVIKPIFNDIEYEEDVEWI